MPSHTPEDEAVSETLSRVAPIFSRGRRGARSMAGIYGTADRPPPAMAVQALPPPSTNLIRKARQAAARRRALVSCRSCRQSR